LDADTAIRTLHEENQAYIRHLVANNMQKLKVNKIKKKQNETHRKIICRMAHDKEY
jgi:hypothetical protein